MQLQNIIIPKANALDGDENIFCPVNRSIYRCVRQIGKSPIQSLAHSG